jgi:tetratricopeptide (TPR) repeat protein
MIAPAVSPSLRRHGRASRVEPESKRPCSGLARGAALLALSVALPACGAAGPEPRPPRALRPIPADRVEAEARWRADPSDLDALVWYGRRVAYEGDFAGAVELYTRGLARFPDEPELLRHRGHRYLSLRRFEEARADLERAAALLEGRPDEIELDGAPNDFEVPRGTLHTNVWYHLGLAFHLLARDAEAARAFAQCLAAAPNDDFRVAAAYWRALALVHLGRGDEARALARLYAERPLELMESQDYAELLRLLAGSDQAAVEALGRAAALAQATLSYGVAMWHRLEGREAEARALLERLTAAPTAAFGCLAAEAELRRMGAPE